MDHSTPQQVRRMCRPGTASDNIVLHADLETLVLPKTYDEQAAFRRRLDAEGELGSLVVWQGRDMLVEGYDAIHAYREQGSAFTVLEQEFKDLEEVKFWILTRQLNRALSGLALCYLRGKRYLLMEKRQGQRTDLTSSKEWSKSTADLLGDEVNAAASTIYKDANVAEAIDAIAAAWGPAAPAGKGPKTRDLILARYSHVTQKRVLRLVQKPVEEQQTFLEQLRKYGRVDRNCREPDEPVTITLVKKPRDIIEGLRKHLKTKELTEVSEGLIAALSL